MTRWWIAGLPFASYLLGALPVGLWIGLFRGIDLREHGSRNIGATNAGRVLGRPMAYLVFVLDFLKGALPVVLARWLREESTPSMSWVVLCGVLAIVGHIFPVYLKFRGGKGVATAAGVFAALDPVATAVAFASWYLLLRVFAMVALSSLIAAWLFPFLIVLFHRGALQGERRSILWFSLAVAVLITVSHRSNIARMLRGEEPRVGRNRRESSL